MLQIQECGDDGAEREGYHRTVGADPAQAGAGLTEQSRMRLRGEFCRGEMLAVVAMPLGRGTCRLALPCDRGGDCRLRVRVGAAQFIGPCAGLCHGGIGHGLGRTCCIVVAF